MSPLIRRELKINLPLSDRSLTECNCFSSRSAALALVWLWQQLSIFCLFVYWVKQMVHYTFITCSHESKCKNMRAPLSVWRKEKQYKKNRISADAKMLICSLRGVKGRFELPGLWSALYSLFLHHLFSHHLETGASCKMYGVDFMIIVL